MTEEVMMIPRQEFERLQDYYKGKITQSALLNKAGRLAAEKHMILKNPKIPSDRAVRMIKPLARQQARLTKRIRLGTAPTVGVGMPDGDEAMVDSPLETLLKQIIKKEAPAAAVPVATPGPSGVKIKKESPSTSGIKKGTLTKSPIPSTSGTKTKLSSKTLEVLKSAGVDPHLIAQYSPEDEGGYSPKGKGKGKHPKAKKTELQKLEEGWQGWGEKKKLTYGKGKGKTRSGWQSD